MKKLYETLGVEPTATQDEIKAAYRRKAAAAHPDRENGCTETMASVNAAYAVLGDPDRRAKYDQTGDTAQEPTDEEWAEKAIAEFFGQHLTDEGDIVKMAKAMFNQSIAASMHDREGLARLMKKLEKRLGLVSVKDGQNIYQLLLNAKILAAGKKMEDLSGEIDVAKAALVRLEAYSFHGIDATSQQEAHIAMLARQINSQFNQSFNEGFSPYNRKAFGL